MRALTGPRADFRPLGRFCLGRVVNLLRIAARVASSPLTEQPDYGTGGASVPRGTVSQEEEIAQQLETGVVRKEKGKGYCVKSEKNPDWSGGCYPTKGEAEKRLNQVEYFKHHGSAGK